MSKTNLCSATFLLLTLTLISGCGESVQAYRVSEHQPKSAEIILVLPVMDVRPVKNPNDILGDKVSERVQDIFVEELQALDIFTGKTIIAPQDKRDKSSLSLIEIIDYGREYNADLVINIQLFSFVDTRAASIPPRAGMFVRICSVKDEKTVFVGEEYRASGAPGRRDRELLARIVIKAILQNYIKEFSTPEPPRGGAIQFTKAPTENVPKLLILPYHELQNPNNFSNEHGGGGVVTGLFQMALAFTGKVEILESKEPYVTHATISTAEEAISIARMYGADYVLRGQVVEFNRATSVPSWWSAAVSISILVPQLIFAEISGVDIATEVYRTSDGACVYAHRDTEHQKFVVRAEKTVRRMATINARRLVKVFENPPENVIEACIDKIVIPNTEPQLAEKPEEESRTADSSSLAQAPPPTTEEVEPASLSVEEE